jgi:predicted site-specific integrase-resolvase
LKQGTYPPNDALGHEWVSEGAIHDMDTREARQKLNEQKVKAIIEAPPEKQRIIKDGQ